MEIHTNREKGVVVAVITRVRAQFKNTIEKIEPMLYTIECVRRVIAKMPNEIRGIAYLAPGDVWNEEKGIEIARNRAILTHAGVRANALSDISSALRNQIINDIDIKAEMAYATFHNRLNILYDTINMDE